MAQQPQIVNDVDDEEEEENVLVQKVPSYLSEHLISNKTIGTADLLADIGIAANPAQVSVMYLKKSSVKPLEISNVTDSTGRISDAIDNYAKRQGLYIIPVDITSVPKQVMPSRHKVVEFRGKEYFCPKTPDTGRIDAFLAECIEELRKVK